MTGQEYVMGYKIVPFVTLGVLFLGLQQQFQAGFLFYKKTGYITFSIITAGLLNLGLNFLFIPKYSYTAAAVTTLISYAFLLFLMILGSRKIFIWQFPFKSLINSIYASAIMGIVIYFLGNSLTSSVLLNLTLSVFFGGLIYFALLFLFREFQPQEKEAMRQILVKYLYRVS
jgi:O-antigen/teichoic acid export membrane protein